MLSLFDIFSIGIGPSSSHTVGPMRAANDFVTRLAEQQAIKRIVCHLYGSLASTGKGHGTDKAVLLGLSGCQPETCQTSDVEYVLQALQQTGRLTLANGQSLAFKAETDLVFCFGQSQAEHANALSLSAYDQAEQLIEQEVYFSVGGGFIQRRGEKAFEKERENTAKPIAYPFTSFDQLKVICQREQVSITEVMLANQSSYNPSDQTENKLWQIWLVMKAAVESGIASTGELPGGLAVKRRANALHQKLTQSNKVDPLNVLDWVNLFALAASEQNDAGGRVVTAPTNGAAGVIPAILCYYDQFIQPLTKQLICQFFTHAGAIAYLYKQNASISGAEVGCQGEVGVACSMAAGALTAIQGGDIAQIENAAEIGMEHHLGMTCDPISGLVQIPCIERNAMGAIKAINASRMALNAEYTPKVSLDKVIQTMFETGKDMQNKYKETSEGGLAINVINC